MDMEEKGHMNACVIVPDMHKHTLTKSVCCRLCFFPLFLQELSVCQLVTNFELSKSPN